MIEEFLVGSPPFNGSGGVNSSIFSPACQEEGVIYSKNKYLNFSSR
jgi:hypothetical protein